MENPRVLVEDYSKMAISDMSHKMEKTAWKSKKFLFGIFVEIALIGLMVLALVRHPHIDWPLASVLSLIVFTMGVIALVFNGYQAALDKYVRGAALDGLRGGIEKAAVAAGKKFGGDSYDEEERL